MLILWIIITLTYQFPGLHLREQASGCCIVSNLLSPECQNYYNIIMPNPLNSLVCGQPPCSTSLSILCRMVRFMLFGFFSRELKAAVHTQEFSSHLYSYTKRHNDSMVSRYWTSFFVSPQAKASLANALGVDQPRVLPFQ